MLPKIVQLEFENVVEQQEDRPQIGRSFLYDFKAGDFVLKDGKLISVEGLEALKVWIEKTIRTERFKFKVYDGTEHGVLLKDLIGSNYPLSFIKAEIERELTDALTRHPVIQSLTNWSTERDGSKTTIAFRVITSEGVFEQEVEVSA